MPIGPKRSGSLDSMMQYTYLPRLAVTPPLTAGAACAPCPVFSETRRSVRPLPLEAGRAARAPAPPFGRGAVFADRFPGFLRRALIGTPLRPRSDRGALPDAFRI